MMSDDEPDVKSYLILFDLRVSALLSTAIIAAVGDAYPRHFLASSLASRIMQGISPSDEIRSIFIIIIGSLAFFYRLKSHF